MGHTIATNLQGTYPFLRILLLNIYSDEIWFAFMLYASRTEIVP